MINKKTLLKLAAISMLAILPISNSSAEDIGGKKMYAKAFGSGIYNFGKFKATDYDVYGGAKIGTDADLQIDSASVIGDGNYSPKGIGFGGGAAVGYEVMDGVSLEVEGVYKVLNVEKSSATNTSEGTNSVPYPEASYFYVSALNKDFWGGASESKRLAKYQNRGSHIMAGLLSAYYNLELSDMMSIYAGAGAGLSQIRFKTYNGEVPFVEEDKTYNALAAQGKAGININVMPNITPYVGYSFMYVHGSPLKLLSKMETFYNPGNTVVTSHPTTKRVEREFTITNLIHNVEAGVKFSFSV